MMKVSLSRRGFLKGAAALAGLAATGVSAQPTLAEQVRSGVIENQHFRLTEPLIIRSNSVSLHNCTFEAVRPLEALVEFQGKNCVMTDCVFYPYRGPDVGLDDNDVLPGILEAKEATTEEAT